jgi:hypothetical protein
VRSAAAESADRDHDMIRIAITMIVQTAVLMSPSFALCSVPGPDEDEPRSVSR